MVSCLNCPNFSLQMFLANQISSNFHSEKPGGMFCRQFWKIDHLYCNLLTSFGMRTLEHVGKSSSPDGRILSSRTRISSDRKGFHVHLPRRRTTSTRKSEKPKFYKSQSVLDFTNKWEPGSFPEAIWDNSSSSIFKVDGLKGSFSFDSSPFLLSHSGFHFCPHNLRLLRTKQWKMVATFEVYWFILLSFFFHRLITREENYQSKDWVNDDKLLCSWMPLDLSHSGTQKFVTRKMSNGWKRW